MPLTFTKMHGLGNDYIYISLFDQELPDPGTLAPVISDRHRGVGGDGLILICPDDKADARMEMYNADGSRSQMCGNGIRCVAKYVHDRGLSRNNPLTIASDAGPLTLDLTLDDAGLVSEVRVDMGEPILEPARIPVALPGDSIVNTPMPLGPEIISVTCVSMGNPHAVIFVDQLARVPLRTLGPQMERHPLFPERINTHWVQVVSRDYVKMATWERGSGPTLACGTGASAVCVAGVLNRLTDRCITAELPGGKLRIEWDEAGNHVFKTGPATEVFTGTWPT
jgi:diaminopimelate epimerase